MADDSDQSRGSGDLLNNSGAAEVKRTQEDIALLSRAVRNGWDVPPDFRKTIKDRLKKIVEKEAVAIMTGEGVQVVDGPADANAIRAATVFVQMAGQDQADDHLADKNKRLDEGKPTERVAGIDVKFG